MMQTTNSAMPAMTRQRSGTIREVTSVSEQAVPLRISLWNVMDFGGGMGPRGKYRWTPIKEPTGWKDIVSAIDSKEKCGELADWKNLPEGKLSNNEKAVLQGRESNSLPYPDALNRLNTLNEQSELRILAEYALYDARLENLAEHIAQKKPDVAVLIELLTRAKKFRGIGTIDSREPLMPIKMIMIEILSRFYVDREMSGEQRYVQLLKDGINEKIEQNNKVTRSRAVKEVSHAFMAVSRLNDHYKELEKEFLNDTRIPQCLENGSVDYKKITELMKEIGRKWIELADGYLKPLLMSQGAYDQRFTYPWNIYGHLSVGHADVTTQGILELGIEWWCEIVNSLDVAKNTTVSEINLEVISDSDEGLDQEQSEPPQKKFKIDPGDSSAIEDVSESAEEKNLFSGVLIAALNVHLKKKGYSDIEIGPQSHGETVGITTRLALSGGSVWTKKKIEKTFSPMETERPIYTCGLEYEKNINVELLIAHAPTAPRRKTSSLWYNMLNKHVDMRLDIEEAKHIVLAGDMNTLAGNDDPFYCDWFPSAKIHMQELTSYKKKDAVEYYNDEHLNPFDKILARSSGVSGVSKFPFMWICNAIDIETFSNEEGGRRYSDHALVTRDMLFTSTDHLPAEYLAGQGLTNSGNNESNEDIMDTTTLTSTVVQDAVNDTSGTAMDESDLHESAGSEFSKWAKVCKDNQEGLCDESPTDSTIEQNFGDVEMVGESEASRYERKKRSHEKISEYNSVAGIGSTTTASAPNTISNRGKIKTYRIKCTSSDLI